MSRNISQGTYCRSQMRSAEVSACREAISCDKKAAALGRHCRERPSEFVCTPEGLGRGPRSVEVHQPALPAAGRSAWIPDPGFTKIEEDGHPCRLRAIQPRPAYRFSSLIGARAGFTISLADALGYSLSAGLDFFFRSALTLKYTLQYLCATVEYQTDVRQRSGISNALILDVRF